MACSAIEEAAYDYAARGWRVVPVARGDKRPWLPAWQENATTDETIIAKWFEQRPDSNIGVALGPSSGILDVECDDERAEETLQKLFEGQIPPCPTFSAHRGKHRLFKWQQGLPEPAKAVVKIGALEIRTGNGGMGAQSVFPPSIHPTGAAYRWIIHPDDAAPPALSPLICVRLLNMAGMGADELSAPTTYRRGRDPEQWEILAEGVNEGGRNAAACAWAGKLLEQTSNVFDAAAVSICWTNLKLWNSQNKPPLEEEELIATFKSILARERRKRTDQEHADLEATYRPAVPVGAADEIKPSAREKVLEKAVKEAEEAQGLAGDKPSKGWRGYILDTKPQRYLIYGPAWVGPLELATDDMFAGARVRRAALEQKKKFLPPAFVSRWEGKGRKGVVVNSLAGEILDAAFTVSAPPELHRDRMVARALAQKLQKAITLRDGGEIRKDCSPTALEDGSIVFSFDRIYRDLALGEHRVSIAELTTACATAGAERYQPYKLRGAALRRVTAPGLEALIAYSEQGSDAIEKAPPEVAELFRQEILKQNQTKTDDSADGGDDQQRT